MEYEKIKCDRCGYWKPSIDFFTTKQGHKDNLCKDCRCEGGKPYQPWTYFKVMQHLDIPYIEEEWLYCMFSRMKRIFRNEVSYKPHSVFSLYYSKMKLCSFKNYTFKDSREINLFNKKRHENNELKKIFIDNNILEYIDISGGS